MLFEEPYIAGFAFNSGTTGSNDVVNTIDWIGFQVAKGEKSQLDFIATYGSVTGGTVKSVGTWIVVNPDGFSTNNSW